MVSDIRTVCPLRQFAKNFRESFSASEVSFYVNQEANPLEEDERGNVADSSTDISAIFGLYEDASFGEKLQSKFFQFVTGKIDKLGDDVTVFDEEDVKDSDEKCSKICEKVLIASKPIKCSYKASFNQFINQNL